MKFNTLMVIFTLISLSAGLVQAAPEVHGNEQSVSKQDVQVEYSKTDKHEEGGSQGSKCSPWRC